MEYVYTVLILIGIYTILAASFNLIIGFGGLISIAHPIFFALAAYCSALLNMKLGVPIPLAILAGALFSTVLSFALSLPSLRVSGDYFVVTSFGIQLLATAIFTNWTGGTGGAAGLPGIPAPIILGQELIEPSAFLFLSSAMMALGCLCFWLIMRAPFGALRMAKG